MTNLRLEAYKILQKVVIKRVFSSRLLEQVRRKSRLRKNDYNLLLMLVKGVLKMRMNLDYIASRFVEADRFSKTDPRIKILLNLGFYQLIYCDQIPDHAAVNETVEIAKQQFGNRIASFVNALLRSYQKNPEIEFPQDPVENLMYRYSFPRILINSWLKTWDLKQAEALCEYFNQVPRLSIRINSFATDRTKLRNYFHRRDIQTVESKASPQILLTRQNEDVLNDIAFEEGYYSIQDESAALVVELMKPEPNESILDFFAGPGGKATYIAELMHNSGELIVIDKFPQKIKKIKQNAERLQITNMNIINEDAFNYGPVAAAYDRVILDVPCSGWGVLQRKAELRWQAHQELKELLKIQANALRTGARFVKQGGILCYSTCTLNEEENERQVEDFLTHNGEFELLKAGNYIPQEYTSGEYLKTIPFLHQMDGAFGAKMRRK